VKKFKNFNLNLVKKSIKYVHTGLIWDKELMKPNFLLDKDKKNRGIFLKNIPTLIGTKHVGNSQPITHHP